MLKRLYCQYVVDKRQLLIYNGFMSIELVLSLIGVTGSSQRVLLELPLKGVSREDAYRIVQRNAMKVWEGLQHGKSATNEQGESLYLQFLLDDEELRQSLSEEAIRECFNFDYYTKNVDRIFARVFK